jgi:hypothetical protein
VYPGLVAVPGVVGPHLPGSRALESGYEFADRHLWWGSPLNSANMA